MKLALGCTALVTLCVALTYSARTADDRGADTRPTFVGLKNGDDVPSFMPWHVSGPHQGKAACPLCVYSKRPGVAVWARPAGLAAAVRIATELDRAIEQLKPRSAVGYVVLLPDKNSTRTADEAQLRAAFASTPLQNVFLTVADRAGNEQDIEKYRIDPASAIQTSTIVYVNRTATTVLQDLDQDARNLTNLGPTLADLFDEEAPYREIAVRMCPESEPGEPLEFYGRILDENGRPLEKASVIAYSTDQTGRYVSPSEAPTSGRTPRLRAVAVTNNDGWYRFTSIKPGPYPGTDDPAHIHMHVDAAVHQHMYRTLWFDGDPRITPEKRAWADRDTETVIVQLRKRDDGVWVVRHDIRLSGS